MTSAWLNTLLANNAAMVIFSNMKMQIWHVYIINMLRKEPSACMYMHMCDSLACIKLCCFILELCFSRDICHFVDSHYHHLPNEGGISTSVPKAELTEGTSYIDVISNLTPIYYKLLLAIVLSL